MELRHLQTFAAVVEQQSFTAAAKARSMTQSAVSHHIAVLQQEFRVPLFQRCGRRMLPTEAGKSFYGYVRRMLDLLMEARQNVGGQATAITGSLRLVACSIAADTLLPAELARFRQVYPQVKEELTVCGSRQAIRAVESGTADLAIVVEPPESPALAAVPIACDELVLTVSPDHHLTASTPVRLSQLRGETLIGREQGSGTRSCFERALREVGVSAGELPISIEMNSDGAILAAVEHGLGISFLPRGAIQDALAAGRLVAVPLADVRLRFQLHLVTNPQSPRTPAAEAFLRLLQG
jgi:DNA-binding transcriptional LysR family regulator